jgi:hypothetical protein
LHETVEQVAIEFAHARIEPQTPYRVVERGLFADTYYAIPTEELLTLQDIGGLLVSVLPHLSAGAIPKLAAILFRYRRQRVELSANQGVLLLTMKEQPSKTWKVHDLAVTPPFSSLPARERTLDLLQSLEACPRPEALPVRCVYCNALGEWGVLV